MSSPKSRRVVVLGINYRPETTGIAPYTTAMAEGLAASGLDVRVITGIPHYPQWQVRDERYLSGRRWHERVNGIQVTRLKHFVPARAGLLGRARMESEFMARASRLLHGTPSDAVIAVTPSLAGAAAAVVGARGRPIGVIVQDLTGAGAAESGTAGRLAGSAITRVELALLRRAALIGVITPRFGEILAEHGIDPDRIVEVPNFTHVKSVKADQEAARERLGWPASGTVVVHTGNLGMKQGLESVVEAARLADKRRSDVTFVLVGAGNQRAGLEAQGRDVRRLRFVDPVSEDDYPYVLAAANILLLNERPGVLEMSMPSKLTSYVSGGRPIAAAVEIGGITQTVLAEAGCAELIPPGDPRRLLSAVEELASNPRRRDELVGAAAAMGAKRYSRDAAVQRYERFSERLLGLA